MFVVAIEAAVHLKKSSSFLSAGKRTYRLRRADKTGGFRVRNDGKVLSYSGLEYEQEDVGGGAVGRENHTHVPSPGNVGSLDELSD